MKSLWLCAALGAPLAAQDIFEQGARLFRTSCAVGYCHGSGGTQGRAPKLTGRSLDRDSVMKATRDGIPNSGMPGWKDRLTPPELDAVVAYVVKISGGNTAGLATASSAPAPPVPNDVRRGKNLFMDPVRGVNRCNTCHSLEGMGTAAGPNLAVSSHDAASIRDGKPATVRLAMAPDGGRFPALLVEQKDDSVRVYDLTSIPPVLRTFPKSGLTFSADSPWRHANAVRNYSAEDLAAIAAYLRWIANQ